MLFEAHSLPCILALLFSILIFKDNRNITLQKLYVCKMLFIFCVEYSFKVLKFHAVSFFSAVWSFVFFSIYGLGLKDHAKVEEYTNFNHTPASYSKCKKMREQSPCAQSHPHQGLGVHKLEDWDIGHGSYEAPDCDCYFPC